MKNREALKILQSQLGMTNQALADSLDLSLSIVSKYRTGAVPTPLAVVYAMRFLLLDRAIQSAQ
jgi:predicted transcriptional regulator